VRFGSRRGIKGGMLVSRSHQRFGSTMPHGNARYRSRSQREADSNVIASCDRLHPRTK
jgi:hypothetical protein